MIEAVFFDFDGVICDSVNIKTVAFSAIYREYGKKVENKAVEHHLMNGGLSRYEKFRFCHKEYLGIELNDVELEILAERFSNLVFEKILQADYIDGAIDTLRKLYMNKTPAYIVSATPDNEIKEIIYRRDLNIYFKEVHGSPKSKELIVQGILFKEGYDSKNCLFIGDSLSDLAAANYNNMPFLGILHRHNNKIFPCNIKVLNSVNISELI